MCKKTLTAGINVKGFFIMGFPNETEEQMCNTKNLISDLNQLNNKQNAKFRASVFEFRPYPGTREWSRILEDNKDVSIERLLQYASSDITQGGKDEDLYARDEFSASLSYSFSKVPVEKVRKTILNIMKNQGNNK